MSNMWLLWVTRIGGIDIAASQQEREVPGMGLLGCEGIGDLTPTLKVVPYSIRE